MIFFYELAVYIPYFLECFLIAYLMLCRCEKKAHYRRNMALLLAFGTAWQLPVSALILIDTPGVEMVFGFVKFTISLAPLYFFVGLYRIKVLSASYIFTLAILFQRWSSVFADIVVGFTPLKEEFFFNRAISWLSYALMIIPVWYFYIRNAGQEDISEQDGITILLFVLLFSLFEIVQPIVRASLENRAWELVFSVAELAFFIFMLYQSVRVARRSRERAEMMVSDALLKRERQQFEQLKQNMESMKAQAHDIKYILRAVKESGADAGLTAKLAGMANMYEASFNTGDAALDVILSDAEKNFRAKKIRFECFTESCDLTFIENYDLYSLLGNAFDNAAEYLFGIDEQKRYVSFTLKSRGGFLFMEVSNYYEGKEDVCVGMKTSKPDGAMHGYGVKNMQRVIKKYGGEFSVRAEGGSFYVTALVPVPDKEI